MRYKNYASRIEFDVEDRLFVGHFAGIRDVIGFHGETVAKLEAAFHEVALSFNAEMGVGILESDLQLPAGDQPLEDIDGDAVAISARPEYLAASRSSPVRSRLAERRQNTVTTDRGIGGGHTAASRENQTDESTGCCC
jgi:hypothetical protein